jgi:hypothetical protein
MIQAEGQMAFPIEALSAIFSILAGGFWISAAYAMTEVTWPWRTPRPVPEVDRPRHQLIWNRRAAVCAAIAAILQAVLFLVTKAPLLFQ